MEDRGLNKRFRAGIRRPSVRPEGCDQALNADSVLFKEVAQRNREDSEERQVMQIQGILET